MGKLFRAAALLGLLALCTVGAGGCKGKDGPPGGADGEYPAPPEGLVKAIVGVPPILIVGAKGSRARPSG